MTNKGIQPVPGAVITLIGKENNDQEIPRVSPIKTE